MDALKLIRQPIECDMSRYKDVFDSYMSHSNTLLNEVLKFVGDRNGKMMRPILTMLTAKLFGEIDDRVLNTAATFEFFHTASLIHDDIVDESELRRGQASVNGSYDNKVAVLVGDFILACALKCACATSDVRLVEVVSDTAQRLADGELLQLRSVHNQEISEDIYIKIIKDKTAALFAACAESGARAVGASENDVERLKMFGEMVGISFQIRDDIFDYQDDKSIGKPVGNDMKEGKLTLPVIHALYKVGSDEMFAIARKVKNGTVEPDEVKQLVEFTKSNGGIEYAYGMMERYASEAKALLDVYSDSPVKDSLCLFVDYVIGRKF